MMKSSHDSWLVYWTILVVAWGNGYFAFIVTSSGVHGDVAWRSWRHRLAFTATSLGVHGDVAWRSWCDNRKQKQQQPSRVSNPGDPSGRSRFTWVTFPRGQKSNPFCSKPHCGITRDTFPPPRKSNPGGSSRMRTIIEDVTIPQSTPPRGIC